MAVGPKQVAPMWVYPKIDPESAKRIVEELHIHPVMAQILVSRGFCDIDAIQHHLYSKLPDLLDPYLFADMEKAVERIAAAIEGGEHIIIYGDNDVDGMTSTALLTEFLQMAGANVSFFVPDRTALGQTIMGDALKRAKECNAKLLITVDCGITAAKEIAAIVEAGVDVIVTDHHEPTEKIPHCVATLNPKLVDKPYPNRDLTGVGVAFKLIHALTTYLTKKKKLPRGQIDLKHYLDLVALGTVADMGALCEENRILVRYGLQRLRRTLRVGLRKLAEVNGVNIHDIKASDLASKLAPPLNSLGRIADPKKGVDLLLVQNTEAAEKLALELDLNNTERQKIEQLVSSDVEARFEEQPELLKDKAIVMGSDKWHPGVIAIVSTRISRTYNRPTMMIAIENGIGKASIRTIREFPLLTVLKESADILINFGGHDYAAGLTIREEDIPTLKKRFIAAANNSLGDYDVISKLIIDARINFDQLTFDMMELLTLLEPHGNENPAPILYADAQQVRVPKVVGGRHLKFYLMQDGRQLEGIGFGMAHRRPELMHRSLTLRLAFTPQVNTFQRKQSIQLLIRDFKVL